MVTNAGNRRGNQRLKRTELVHIHTDHRDFKGGTPEVGATIGLMSKK